MRGVGGRRGAADHSLDGVDAVLGAVLARAAEDDRADLDGEVAELARAGFERTNLDSRLRACLALPEPPELVVHVAGGRSLRGELEDAGAGWLSLAKVRTDRVPGAGRAGGPASWRAVMMLSSVSWLEGCPSRLPATGNEPLDSAESRVQRHDPRAAVERAQASAGPARAIRDAVVARRVALVWLRDQPPSVPARRVRLLRAWADHVDVCAQGAGGSQTCFTLPWPAMSAMLLAEL